jgi:hypothetical protein
MLEQRGLESYGKLHIANVLRFKNEGLLGGAVCTFYYWTDLLHGFADSIQKLSLCQYQTAEKLYWNKVLY